MFDPLYHLARWLGVDVRGFRYGYATAVACFCLLWLLVGCTPSDDIVFEEAASCGDSICLDVGGSGVVEDEVYVGEACERGTGEGVDLSACCPDGYEAAGYCDASDHIVACVRECDS